MKQRYHTWVVVGTFCLIQLILFADGETKSKLAGTDHEYKNASKSILTEDNDDEDMFDDGSGSAMIEGSGFSINPEDCHTNVEGHLCSYNSSPQELYLANIIKFITMCVIVLYW